MHLVCVIGPLAVGKMTVGREVCARTGFRLFHNHLSIEPLIGIFDFGTPSFNRISSMIRHQVITEAVVESTARFNTDPSDAADWPLPQCRHLRLDNAHDSPGQTAELIVEQLGLPHPLTP